MSLEADVRWREERDRLHDHKLASSSGVNMKASTTETPPPTLLNAEQRKKRRIEAGTSETVGETVEPMDEGDEGDDEEALLDAAQLSPERLAYTESEYGLPGTGSQEERAEAAVEALRAQSGVPSSAKRRTARSRRMLRTAAICRMRGGGWTAIRLREVSDDA